MENRQFHSLRTSKFIWFMISFEKQLERIVAVLPAYYTNVIKYGWGDVEQLNQVLTTRNVNTHYPLIWLNLGQDRFDRFEKTVTRNASILIAVNVARETLADLNPTIQSKYFETCLEPITENLIQALESSGISQIMNSPIEIERIPNISVQKNEKQIIDIWHVIKIEAEIKFSNQQCNINTIKFKNRFGTDNNNGGGGDGNSGGNNGGGGNNSGGNNNGVENNPCELGIEGTTFFMMNASFRNTKSPITDIQLFNIRDLTIPEILEMWFDNENFGQGSGGILLYICGANKRFEVGDVLIENRTNQPLSDSFDGWNFVNQTGNSGLATNVASGIQYNYRFNPLRTSPYINPPVGVVYEDWIQTQTPIPFSFFLDTVEPVLIRLENSTIMEIVSLPLTGFANEE